MTDEDEFFRIERDEAARIMTITLNRPESLNALMPGEGAYLRTIWESVSEDDGIDAIIITGSGRAFCAGINVKAVRARADDGTPHRRGGTLKTYRAMAEVPQPIIAAVNGDAVGAGSTLALNCDFVIASETARIGDPHVHQGLVSAIGTMTYTNHLGIMRAKHLLMTGYLVPAEEAYRMGLVTKVCAADQVMVEARALAESLVASPQVAVRGTKKAINRLARLQWDMFAEASLQIQPVWNPAGLKDKPISAR